ncbi:MULTISPECIES: acyltransferase [unclassified Rhizobium]|jgi:glucan biosynthesis protein C|uniref:acyltransferase family protein n=1 Tax=unclassified Rhizobium TaxID=2613769 RepID=UPI000647D974|nr:MULTISPECIES: acyltransferase [unclassified Rhizobium]MBN8953417.1 acyltransferase [Rhizobium tropici]OJY74428.1 MAG: hypothetical protein BGP09_18320 [Rhizobium sp. 60-20]RKD67980.1 acyltransferase-like protein [Rhizobium sp. WW_1]
MEKQLLDATRPETVKAQIKNAAIGNLRTCVTLLVVLHHSLLAYVHYAHFDRHHYLSSTAPIVDGARWLGFDLLVDFNDIYFMSLMFFISGIFVIPSLRRRGPWNYLSSRIVRLGIPFMIAVTILMPAAYYPSYLQTGADLSFPSYWAGYFGSYGWPAGPAWFIWVLLTFDSVVVLTALLAPALIRKSAMMPNWLTARPFTALALFLAIALGAYLPALDAFGPTHWFSWGPFAVQASRLLLYMAFFVAGAVAGSEGAGHELFGKTGPFARWWLAFAIVGCAAFGGIVLIQIETLRQSSAYSGPASPVIAALLFVVTCSAISIALIGGFIRHVDQSSRWASLLSSCAFGIYLVHYVALTWIQAALVGINEPAAIKAVVAFVATLFGSWIAVALLRQQRSLRYIL